MRELKYTIDVNQSTYYRRVAQQNDDVTLVLRIIGVSLEGASEELTILRPDGSLLTTYTVSPTTAGIIVDIGKVREVGNYRFVVIIKRAGKQISSTPLDIIVEKTLASPMVDTDLTEVYAKIAELTDRVNDVESHMIVQADVDATIKPVSDEISRVETAIGDLITAVDNKVEGAISSIGFAEIAFNDRIDVADANIADIRQLFLEKMTIDEEQLSTNTELLKTLSSIAQNNATMIDKIRKELNIIVNEQKIKWIVQSTNPTTILFRSDTINHDDWNLNSVLPYDTTIASGPYQTNEGFCEVNGVTYVRIMNNKLVGYNGSATAEQIVAMFKLWFLENVRLREEV